MRGGPRRALPEEGTGLADEISRETDGNPFFVAEILRHLDEAGAMSQDDGGHWALTPPWRPRPAAEHSRGGDEQGGAAGRRDRLAALDRGGDRPRLRSRTPRRAGGRERGRGARPLDGAVRGALLLRGAIAGAVHLRPLAGQQHPLRRPRRDPAGPDAPRIAEALEEMCGDDAGERSEELAWHWLRTTTPQMPLKAAEHSIRAGERALAPSRRPRRSTGSGARSSARPDPGGGSRPALRRGDRPRRRPAPARRLGVQRDTARSLRARPGARRRRADGPRRRGQHARLRQRRRPGRPAPGRGAGSGPGAVRRGQQRARCSRCSRSSSATTPSSSGG